MRRAQNCFKGMMDENRVTLYRAFEGTDVCISSPFFPAEEYREKPKVIGMPVEKENYCVIIVEGTKEEMNVLSAHVGYLIDNRVRSKTLGKILRYDMLDNHDVYLEAGLIVFLEVMSQESWVPEVMTISFRSILSFVCAIRMAKLSELEIIRRGKVVYRQKLPYPPIDERKIGPRFLLMPQTIGIYHS